MADEHDDDVKLGREILTAWKPRLAALTPSGVVPGVDLRLAAVGAQSTWRRAEALGIFDRLRALPADIFDPTCIDDTRNGALALFAADRDLAGWTPPSVTVPADLVDDCITLRREMAEVLRYALTDEDALVRIARILRGTGFLDLGTDLGEFSEMYEEFADDLVEGGGRRYQPDDARRAAKLSTRMIQLLTQPGGDITSPLVVGYTLFGLVDAAHQELVDGIWIVQRKVDRKPWSTLKALSRRPRRVKKVATAVGGQ